MNNNLVLQRPSTRIVLKAGGAKLTIATVILSGGGGGSGLPQNQVNALNAANSPSGDNPFATLNDAATAVSFSAIQAALLEADSFLTLGGGNTFTATAIDADKMNIGSTTLAASDVTLVGWGAGASVSAVTGGPFNGTVTVTSGSAPSANPTVDIPFTNDFNTGPNVFAKVIAPADAVLAQAVPTVSAFDHVTLTFDGTPEAGVAYTIQFFALGQAAAV